MSVTIGFIMSETASSYIRKVTDSLQLKNCVIKHLTYNDIKNVHILYEMHENIVDGFIFSGELIYRHFLTMNAAPKKPCFYLSITTETILSFLLSELVVNRDLNLNRIFVDCIYDHSHTFFEVLGDNMPQHMETLYNNFPKDVENSLQTQIRLFEDNKIDLAVTRLGENLPELTKRGFNSVLITPSSRDIIEKIKTSAKDIELMQFKRRNIVVARVSVDRTYLAACDRKEKEQTLTLLQSRLAKTIGQEIQKQESGFDVIYYGSDIKTLTKNFTRCPVLSQMEQMPYPVVVSVSEGFELKQILAVCESLYKYIKRKEEAESYAIFDNGDIIGPLSKKGVIKFSHKWDPVINVVSMRSKIAVDTIKKIKGYIEKKNEPVTSSDIAELLNISNRSSNRILKILTEAGFASVHETENLKLKGRPRKTYTIHFDI